MIDKQDSSLSFSHQCRILGLHRSGLYYSPCSESPENLVIMRLLDEQYFKTPFYGTRKLTAWLKGLGYDINRKRVKRLMDLMGWQTSYPYMLKGLAITRVNQVWAMDITYVPM